MTKVLVCNFGWTIILTIAKAILSNGIVVSNSWDIKRVPMFTLYSDVVIGVSGFVEFADIYTVSRSPIMIDFAAHAT